MEFSIVFDDIAQQEADSLVSAAETSLQMEGAVADALRSAATGSIADTAASEAPLPLGAIAVTDAPGLNAAYLIHAAATPSYGSGQASAASIRAATSAALAEAERLDCESLVLPVIGTGTAGFEFKEGAHIICELISEYDPTTLEDVRVITNVEQEYNYLERIAANV
ncbi:macro domain-containing protein [Haloarcula sp. JP-L23]|uniref:macro domain-containing protein n=1 Tax=Haloarcula sp. JP-L23 TaxID=2716717 RepID=UPI00140EBCDE|nr:Appr-1-p processing protein [Haloarcula sp. JP-L23]